MPKFIRACSPSLSRCLLRKSRKERWQANMSLCKSPHRCWRSVSVHVAWDTQALPQCASKWEVDRNKSKCFSVYVSLSVCISWLGWKSINQSPFWSFFSLFIKLVFQRHFVSFHFPPFNHASDNSTKMDVFTAYSWAGISNSSVLQTIAWLHPLVTQQKAKGLPASNVQECAEWLFPVHWHLKRWKGCRGSIPLARGKP